MAHQVLSANTLANPVRLLKFLEAATKSLQLDEGLGSLAKIAKLGVEFRGIGLDNIKFITVPWQYAPDDPNRIRWLPQAKQVWTAIINDKPLAPRFLNDAISAEQLPGSPEPSQSPSQSTSEPTGRSAGPPGPNHSPGSSASPTASPTQQSSEAAAEAARANGLCT